MGQTRLGGSFVIHVLQLILQWIDLLLGGQRRGFSFEFFDFLFDNTSWCYLVFASFFPTLLAFILLLIFVEYGLELFYHLFARIYSYFALSLSQSKNNQAVTFYQGSKQALVFSHKFELSRCLSVVEICVGKKVLWKYVLCYLNNENYCLNNTTKWTLSNT